jgi:hypothetical protein
MSESTCFLRTLRLLRLPRLPRLVLASVLALGLCAAHAAPEAAAPAAGASAPAAPAPADAAASTPAPVALDARAEALKRELIGLNRDLLVLEEELLFPASTQVAVFVSMDMGLLFELDSVQVLLDDKPVAAYLYTPREVQALVRGGVQRLYLGNLRTGEHTLVAYFTGKGTHERDYKRGTTVKFEKGSEPKYVELRIHDSAAKIQPEFDVKVWQ